MQSYACTALLYGDLREEVLCMKQPEGYEDGSNKVCKPSLYGLIKQAQARTDVWVIISNVLVSKDQTMICVCSSREHEVAS